MARAAHRSGTPATVALTAAGVEFEVHPYLVGGDTRAYGLEAAAALDLDPDRVFKTLVTAVDGALTLAVVPVSGSLDLKALAAAAGGKRAAMAEVSDAQRSTGYVLGGISPVGTRSPLPVVIDETIYTLDRVFVSAGRRGLQMSLAPADLVTVTSARTAPIRRPG